MKEKALLDAFEYIDDKYLDIAEATRRFPGRKALWITAAAAVLVVAAVTALLSASPYFRRLSPDDAIVVPDAAPFGSFDTSDRYDTLSELLSAISGNDLHHYKQSDSEGGRGSSIDSSASSSPSVTFGDYTYQANTEDSYTGIWHQRADGPVLAGKLENYSIDLFIIGDRLAAVSTFQSGGTELDYEISTRVEIYSLANPAAPELLDSYILLGQLSACYCDNGQLYVFVSDGICACGWSRLSDPNDYKPALKINGMAAEWEDSAISILGSPSQVQYTALCAVDAATGELTAKHAFYGDISTISHGTGWFALITDRQGELSLTHPDIYTFDTAGSALSYTGKISCAAIFGLPERTQTLTAALSGGLPDGLYPEVLSVSRRGDEYRIIGRLMTVKSNSWSAELMVITAQPSSGALEYALHSCEGKTMPTIDEILWEENRVIMTVSAIDPASYAINSSFVVVGFDGGITFHDSSPGIDYVNGIEGIYSLGSPFGTITTLIPLGDGIFLRQNASSTGIDIFDLSDSTAPRCIYRSSGDIDPASRLYLYNYVYDDRTVGILRADPNEQGELRQVTYTWCVFSIDPESDSPVSLISEIPFTPGFDPSLLDFAA